MGIAQMSVRRNHLTLSLMVLFLAPTMILAQTEDTSFEDIFRPAYIKSKWQLVRDDSLKVIVDTVSKRVDTILVSEHITKSDDPADLFYYFDSDYRVISIVGDFLSYDYSYEGSGGAHPISGSYYRTINVNTRKEVNLDELFSSLAILHALRQDSNVTKYSSGDKNSTTLSQFVSSLHGECEVDFYDMLASYAIYSLDDKAVTISFGLNHGCEAEPQHFTVIKILLPRKDSLVDFN